MFSGHPVGSILRTSGGPLHSTGTGNGTGNTVPGHLHLQDIMGATATSGDHNLIPKGTIPKNSAIPMDKCWAYLTH